jgi:hypothetical protein
MQRNGMMLVTQRMLYTRCWMIIHRSSRHCRYRQQEKCCDYNDTHLPPPFPLDQRLRHDKCECSLEGPAPSSNTLPHGAAKILHVIKFAKPLHIQQETTTNICVRNYHSSNLSIAARLSMLERLVLFARGRPAPRRNAHPPPGRGLTERPQRDGLVPGAFVYGLLKHVEAMEHIHHDALEAHRFGGFYGRSKQPPMAAQARRQGSVIGP